MSEHRHVALRDRRVAPAEPDRRGSRQAVDEPRLSGDRRSPGRGPSPEGPAGRHGRGGKKKKGGGENRMRVLAWISVIMTCVLVAGVLTGYALYRQALAGIKKRDIASELGSDRPANTTGALNVLLVGSDTREGENKKYGRYLPPGERTDTIILLHVSPERNKAMLLSFPRDSMVQIPACTNPRTKAPIPPRLDMINSAFNDGGIVCTIKTLESLTGIRIDHYIKVDFTGFKNIVNALGGIEICLPVAVNDRKAKLNLPAGRHVVKGEAALGYVRLRNIGDGSDIGRIKRQQIFLAQVVKKATSTDLLTNPARLFGFVSAAARSVEMDSELNTETLIQIAQSSRNLLAKNVKFITVPWEPYPEDKNRVQWKQPDAEKLFAAIRNDVELPSPTPTAKATPGASAKPAIKPRQVRLQVLNGTGEAGKAREVAEALAAQGFTVTSVGNAPVTAATELRYPARNPAGADYAAPVSAKLLTKAPGAETAASGKVKPTPGRIKGEMVTPFTPSTAASAGTAATQAADGAAGPVIQLVIGKDFEGVKAPITIPDSARVVDAKTDVCTV